MVKSGVVVIDINSFCVVFSLFKLQYLVKLDCVQFFMLGVVCECGWGVIVDQCFDGCWIFISEEGYVLVSDSDLNEGVYKVDFGVFGNKLDQYGFECVFKEVFGEYCFIIMEVVIVLVVMSVIVLGVLVFLMQVYDCVILIYGVVMLIVLVIGVLLVIVFELGMKFVCFYIMDSVVFGFDVKFLQVFFECLLLVWVDQLLGFVGSLVG